VQRVEDVKNRSCVPSRRSSTCTSSSSRRSIVVAVAAIERLDAAVLERVDELLDEALRRQVGDAEARIADAHGVGDAGKQVRLAEP